MSIQPLLEPSLVNFCESRIIGNEQLSETRYRAVGRYTAQCAIVALGAVGKIPYYKPNLTFAGDHRGWGIFLATNETAAFSAWSGWALYNIMGEFLDPEKISTSQFSRCQKAAVLTSAFVIAFISEIPGAFLAYTFNNKQIIMPILVVISDIWGPMYSLKLSFETLLRKTDRSQFAIALREIQQKTVDQIQKYMSHLESQDLTVQHTEITRLRRLDAAQLFAEFFAPSTAGDQVPDCYASRLTPLAYLLGAILTLSYVGTYSFYGAQGASKVYEAFYKNATDASQSTDRAVEVTGGILVGAALTYLTQLCIVTAMTGAFYSIANIARGVNPPSMSRRISPGLTCVAKGIALIASCFAWAPTVVGCQELYTNAFWRLYMQVTVSIANTLVLAAGTSQVANGILETCLARSTTGLKWLPQGNAEEREVLQFHGVVRKFMRMISDSSPRHFASLYTSLSEDTRSKLTVGIYPGFNGDIQELSGLTAQADPIN